MPGGVVIALLRLFPSRAQHRQVLGILRSVLGPTQARPHCLDCRLYEEANGEEAVLLVEAWDSEPEFQRHIQSALYRRVLEAVELSRRSPEVGFHSIAGTQGMEYIERLRGSEPTAQPQ